MARARHPVHFLGAPGVGKSVAAGSLTEAIIAQSDGAIVFDIKDGRLARDLAARTRFRDRLRYIAPGLTQQAGQTWGLNILAGEPATVVDNVLDLFERTGRATFEVMTQVRRHLTMALWLAVATPGATLVDVYAILTDQHARERFLQAAGVMDEVRAFWEGFNKRAGRGGETSLDQRKPVDSTVVRLEEFLLSEPLRAMLRQPSTTLDLGGWLDQGQLVGSTSRRRCGTTGSPTCWATC